MIDFLKKQKIKGLAAWVLLSFLAAAVGGAATVNAGTFYTEQLVLPAWAPPGGVFGPVWTVLYLLMGISAWLVWREGGFKKARRALYVFIFQLVLNGLWSWLFFGWKLGGAAFANILILWVLLLTMDYFFMKKNKLAGFLQVPYLLWVSFAAILNYYVWQLNPQILG
ncbi:MAG: tryptophan-rich sensory protein [Deltaproteobacteria bacterium]|nr:tryptophan-rich sensory protein [Deltaproteobacteria bacterium]